MTVSRQRRRLQREVDDRGLIDDQDDVRPRLGAEPAQLGRSPSSGRAAATAGGTHRVVGHRRARQARFRLVAGVDRRARDHRAALILDRARDEGVLRLRVFRTQQEHQEYHCAH